MSLENKISFDFDGTFIKQHTGLILAKEAIKYNRFNLPYFLKNFSTNARNINKKNFYLSMLACVIKGFPYEKAKQIMGNVTLKKDIISRTIESYLKKGQIKTKKGLAGITILTYNDLDGVEYSLLAKENELKRLGIYVEDVLASNFEKDFSKEGELVYNGNLKSIYKPDFLKNNLNIIHHDVNYPIELRGILNFKVIY
ncbi:MAG: hypothetical protein PHV16_04515 [Candidatus Nanoarchaeia archaeon]|nr:hypothetical protein [Candidatus Nanoarchaeia archaeon]